MDKSTTLDGKKVRNNSRYQKDIDRSLAVIYHNLKRIQDEKLSSQDNLPLRRHSDPTAHATNSVQRKTDENTVSRERSHSVTNRYHVTRKNERKVSFSADVVSHSQKHWHQRALIWDFSRREERNEGQDATKCSLEKLSPSASGLWLRLLNSEKASPRYLKSCYKFRWRYDHANGSVIRWSFMDERLWYPYI